MNQQEALDIAISVSGKSCGASGAASLYGWLTGINWLGTVGCIVAVLSFISQIYFNIKRDRRESLEHSKRMES